MRLTILFLFAVFAIAFADILRDDYSNFCFQVVCPPQTTLCRKEVATLKSIRRIRTTVACLDRQGQTLETNVSDDDHYQEGLNIHSVSFTGTMPKTYRYRSYIDP